MSLLPSLKPLSAVSLIYVAAWSHRFVNTKKDFTWEDCNSIVRCLEGKIHSKILCFPWSSAHLQQLWQGLGKQPCSCNSYVKSEVMKKTPGPGPRKRQLPGSQCCSLCCNLSSLYLGSKNLHLGGKIRRNICIGMMLPPTQASSGLELKALLHKSTCIASLCKAIPFLHWTHLATTPWSVQKCKAFPQRVLTEKVLLSHTLKGAITSQRDIIHEQYEWCCILHLTCLTDLLKLVFPRVMDTILYRYPPLWDRKSFCISPLNLPGGDPKQLFVWDIFLKRD